MVTVQVLQSTGGPTRVNKGAVLTMQVKEAEALEALGIVKIVERPKKKEKE